MKQFVSEVFLSLQCEGKYVGRPSVFIRYFGCNFTCAGFGMPRGQLSEERHDIDPDDYDRFEELPVVTTGCDSYASWDPDFVQFSTKYTPDQLSDHVHNQVTSDEWDYWRSFSGQELHAIFTGGEPLLAKSQRFTLDFLKEPEQDNLKHVTFETNGTQILNADLVDFFNNERPDIQVTFAVAAKLPTSGHGFEEAIRPDIVKSYTDQILRSKSFLKFVVDPHNHQDLQDAIKATDMFNENVNDLMPYEVYLMPVGGQPDMYHDNKTVLANWCLQNGFYFSPRLQLDLWKNQWGS